MVCWVLHRRSAGFLIGNVGGKPWGAAWQPFGETPAHWCCLHIKSVPVKISPLGCLVSRRVLQVMQIFFIFSKFSFGMVEILYKTPSTLEFKNRFFPLHFSDSFAYEMSH